RPQFRRPVFVRQSGHNYAIFDEGDLRNRFLATPPLGYVGHHGLGELDVFQGKLADLALGVHTHDRRLALGALSARYREIDVARNGIGGQVIDRQLLDVDAKRIGDLAVDSLNLELLKLRRRRLVVGSDGEDGRPLWIADEQDAFRPKG